MKASNRRKKEDAPATAERTPAGIAPNNSRYESAMAVYAEYCEYWITNRFVTFDMWLRERLYSPKSEAVQNSQATNNKKEEIS